MPSDNPKIKKAFKDGVITKGQYDKLSDGLLLGIIKKKTSSTKKGEVRKTARRAYEPEKKPAPKKKGKGVKEVRKKTGKEKGKVGRPKSGSYVKVEK